MHLFFISHTLSLTTPFSQSLPQSCWLPPFPSRLNSSGRRCVVVGPLPPSPAAYGTHGQHGSGWLPSSTRSSTEDRSRWRRRKEQTSLHSGCPDTRHTAGRPGHMAWLPPESERWKLLKWRHSSVLNRWTLMLHEHVLFIVQDLSSYQINLPVYQSPHAAAEQIGH